MRTLVLGAGKWQRIEGADHQDRIKFAGINRQFDLNMIAWPVSSDHYDQIIATHVVEHLESLIHFMEQCHRALAKGGQLIIETPNAGVNPDLTHCDPTHIRCFRPGTFENYFTERGITRFGYTDKAWTIVEMATFELEVPHDTIRVVLTPIK